MDDAERDLLAETLRKTMTASSGQALHEALTGLGWPDLLADVPEVAVPLVFRLLGETGTHAPLLNDVVLAAAGLPVGGTLPLPYAGGRRVVWERTDVPGTALDNELPLRLVPDGTAVTLAAVPAAAEPLAAALAAAAPLAAAPLAAKPLAAEPLAAEPLAAAPLAAAPLFAAPLAAAPLAAAPLAAGRRAVGWWLVGSGRAMLAMARAHALDRVQFGQRLASFQAVRHKLADTLVALEGAEAALQAAGDEQAAADHFGSLLAKAAAGQAALTAARHCQQILGGLGFTAEYGLHRHVRRALVLDGLLGSARELTRGAGQLLRREASAPRLVRL
jgi:hypothetical protein